MSNAEIIRYLGERFKRYRIRMAMTQKEIAEKSGLSVTTIHKFETGSLSNISMNALLSLLRYVNALETINDILPDLPPSPYTDRKNGKEIQRVKHKRSQS